jgi:glycosyltransferase involved in cell wall biosynthesis
MICIVLNSLGRGGAERSILLLAEELLRQDVPVQIVSLFNLQDEYPVPDALRGHVVRLSARSFLLALLRLRSHLACLHPTALFSLMPQSNLASVLIGRLLGLPVLTSERTTPTLFYRSRLKLFLSLLPHMFSRRAVFISHYALDQGLPSNALGRAVRRNACVLHNPVPFHINPHEARESRRIRLSRLQYWAQDGTACIAPLRLLIASRLVQGKGVLEFIESVLDELATGSIELTIAGVGPLLASLQALLQRHGLASQVRLLGFVDDIQSVYASADVVVLTSESEGFGRVGFEAYQAGCLVLGTPHNSFGHELPTPTPAWKVVPHLAPLKPALASLAASAVPVSGEDINAMRDALGIEAHARNFINIVSRGVRHA